MFGRKKRRLSDFSSEIQSHLDLAAEEFREEGLDQTEARYAALRQFGNVTSAQERFYEAGRWHWLDALGRDLRFAGRLMRKEPGSALAIILTLALAIGVTTAIFSLVNALLFTHLPYDDPERLALLSGIGATVSYDALESFKHRATAFEDVAAYSTTGVTLLGAGEPMHASVAQVTANFPRVMGTHPEVCRLFTPGEDRPGNNSVAMISGHLWRTRFAAEPAVCGKVITLNGLPFTIVGVLPYEFSYPPGVQVWTPTFHTFQGLLRGGSVIFSFIGRISPSLSFNQAAAQYHRIIYPDNPDRGPEAIEIAGVRFEQPPDIQPLRTELSQTGRKPASVLFGAAVLVLLIAYANVTGLVMARIIARQREFAIRQALGISWPVLLRQLLVEHTLLGILGGAGGLLIAIPGINYLKTLLPANWPSYAEVRLDFRVLLFTFAISAVAGIVSGVTSALSTLRTRRSLQALSSGERTGDPVHHTKWRAALICFETALVLALLSSSGLLLKSFLNLMETDPGFNQMNLLTLTVTRHIETDTARLQTRAFYADALSRLSRIPGFTSVGGANYLAVNPQTGLVFFPVSAATGAGDTKPVSARPNSITPDYFRTMGIRFLAGRAFGDRDTTSSERVVVVNDYLARRLWPNRNAIGNKLSMVNQRSATVVGVISSIQFLGPGSDSWPEYYIPYTQWTTDTFSFVIRTTSKSAAHVQAAQAAIHESDSAQPIDEIAFMEDYVDQRMQRPRSLAALTSGFAFLGYALVLVGVYGTIAHAAGRRIREFGIRLALGAEPRQLLMKSVAGSFRSLIPGMILGIGLSLAAGRLIESELYGVKSGNPWMLIAFALFLLATAAAAGALASRCILRVNPVAVLRHE